MTQAQLIQDAQILVPLLVTAIVGYVISPWLRTHAKQVDAATASIQDDRLRSAAQSIVRWVETDPAEQQLPGLLQRQHGMAALAAQLGINLGIAGPAIDDAYNLLLARGQLVIAPKPAAPVPAAGEGAALLEQLKAVLASATQPPAASEPPPAIAPMQIAVSVPATPEPIAAGIASP